MIAHQELAPETRQEHAHVGPCVLQGSKARIVAGDTAAEAVDDERDGDTPPGCGDERVADAPARRIVGKNVIQQLQRLGRAVDQRDKGVEPFAAERQDGQSVAVDIVRRCHDLRCRDRQRPWQGCADDATLFMRPPLSNFR